MATAKAVFVLVHGGWHNHSAWAKVLPLLKARGFAGLTLDLPGAGVHAIAPRSLDSRPFDRAAFATEPSPNAGVTQVQRTQAVVALVRQAASLYGGKVILVGHSAGGMTVSAVAEEVPNLLLAVVYVSGFLVPNGMSLIEMLQHKSLSSALAPGTLRRGPRGHRRDANPCQINRQGLQVPAQIFVLCRRPGVRIRAPDVSTSLRRTERRCLGPVVDYT